MRPRQVRPPRWRSIPGRAAVPLACGVAVILLSSARAGADGEEAYDSQDWKDDTNIVKPPILSPGLSRHEGPIAPWWFDTAVTYTHLGAPTSDGNAESMSLQLAIGPKPLKRNAQFVWGDTFDWLNDYALRLQWSYVMMHGGATDRYAPLTVALQRFFTLAPLEVAPLLHLHLGIEGTFSTPWLDDRRSAPPLVFQKLYAVDTELAHNGYSIQPFGVYVRADAPVCRNLFLEAGVSPEAFIPTEVDRSREYDVRWHTALGWNFACANDPTSWRRPLAVSFEVRGHGRLDSDDGPPQHRALDSILVQYHLWDRLVINLFGSRATGKSLGDYYAVGVRLQLGAGSRSSGPDSE